MSGEVRGLAALAGASMLAVAGASAGELAVPADMIEQAERSCTVDSAGPAFDDCVQQRLMLWSSPEHKARLARTSRVASEIVSACATPEKERFDGCAQRRISKQPEDDREMIEAATEVEYWRRESAREEQRLKAALAACRRAGLKQGTVRIGMSAQAVRDCGWGAPESVNRTITATRLSEQWVYGAGSYLYFENGRLTAIQD